MEAILRIANDAGHSDVHLGVGERPRFRARGEIQATDWPATDDSVFQGWLHEILSPQQIDSFYRDKELDSAYAFPFVRVRINVFDSLRGGSQTSRGAQRSSSPPKFLCWLLDQLDLEKAQPWPP